MGRLQQLGVVAKVVAQPETRYFVDPDLLRDLDFAATTTLRRIEPHRLRALILEDLRRYPDSAIGEIHRRVGEEIDRNQLRTALTVSGAVVEDRWQGRKAMATVSVAPESIERKVPSSGEFSIEVCNRTRDWPESNRLHIEVSLDRRDRFNTVY